MALKRIACLLMILILPVSAAAEDGISFNAKSVILTEASTGKTLFESNSHESLPPASVTKIMTMLLIMEAIDRGEISYDTVVTASERAKSMGGSTIFLDTNEKMSVEDLLKGIAVASGNDACVAMAEHLCGSEEAFAAKMNERAAQLGMKDTHFVNCNGLDAPGHFTSAYDIALMSRELMRHKDIFKFTTIWMDSLRGGKFSLANTMDSLRNGSFGLSNTNKLIRFYSGANGLKTGSTSVAGCCISAAAKRGEMQLIAVVLGAPTSKERFAAASNLLNYGFANYGVTQFGEKGSEIRSVAVESGKSGSVMAVAKESSSALLQKSQIKKAKIHINLPKKVKAPVKKGSALGEIIITLDGETISRTDIVASHSVGKKDCADYMFGFFRRMVLA